MLNKPSGMASHGVVAGNLGVIEVLRDMRPDAPYLELAHRLDKDTSGCLIIAKRKSALRAFARQQDKRGVDKHYMAWVTGRWHGGHRKVDAPLFKQYDKHGKWHVVVDQAQGKRAVSYFVAERVADECSLLRIQIITGRTHQIRVHAAHIGFPILGDCIYGNATSHLLAKKHDLPRLALHAASIRFALPDGSHYAFEAPMPPCMDLKV